ncbi:MAG: hypothetical protein KDI33_19555 [Halioglobus sp.]|nr:hypothetical protein [Halioglobus sp.]
MRDDNLAGAAQWMAASGQYNRAARISLALLLLFYTSFTYAQLPFVQNGKAGFVISQFRYALPQDAAETGACPQGMSLNVQDIFAQTAAGKRLPQESDNEYSARLRSGGELFATAADGQNLCMNPEAGEPDPHFRTVDLSTMPMPGIDLDGGHSAEDRAENTCEHVAFTGTDGETGIDNQFYRVVGCSASFQSTGPSNGFDTEMLTGSWGILMTLSGLDDIVDDDSVEVSIYANSDPIQLSPGRKPLAYATYLADPDPEFSATTQGRIKDGILTTDPTDVLFHHVVNSMYLRRPLRAARLQLAVSEDGRLEGYLAGYAPVEAMYNVLYGYRDGKTSTGELAPLRLRSGSANGAAQVLGHTCNGAYHALYRYADGHRDPETGRCTSISTQYRIEALPAFVIERNENDIGQGISAERSNAL